MQIMSVAYLVYLCALMSSDVIGVWVSNIVPSGTGTYFGMMVGGLNGVAWAVLLARDDTVLARPRLRGPLPKGFRFDRDEANAR